MDKRRGAKTHRHFPEWRHRGNKKPLNDIKSELNVPTLTETETEATNKFSDAKNATDAKFDAKIVLKFFPSLHFVSV